MISTAFVLLAVATGLVVGVIALAVVLVVLFVTVSMRGRRRRGAQLGGEARHELNEAAERTERQHDRDIHDVDEAAERTERQHDRDIHDVEEAAERTERQHDRDIAREGREDIEGDR
jgi:Tfp pilus assembly protein PilN